MGTTIVVGDLYEGIVARFGEEEDSFKTDLHSLISSHFAFIIDKGFKISVNGDIVRSRSRRLLFDPTPDSDGGVIKPYMYKADFVSESGNNVRRFSSRSGFTRPIPSQDEVLGEQEEKRYSTEEAGWTVICNDRAVLYCDRTELTGLG